MTGYFKSKTAAYEDKICEAVNRQYLTLYAME
jgi:hypothetical protein